MVGKAKLHSLLTIPEQTGEHFWCFFQPITAPSFHHVNKLLVDLIQHALGKCPLFVVLRTERVKETLVFSSRYQAAFYAEFVHQAGKAETVHQHPNAANNAGFVDKYLVSRHRDVVGGRSTAFLYHRVDRLLVLGFKAQNFVIHHSSLYWAAAW